ncbi:MAG: aldehyde dehydrogenase family protein, partial [Halobacteriovoraceae bacterium]|nr:aldehyde dehydrogenase family protein [Halobacteriovoraceae bacterium]
SHDTLRRKVQIAQTQFQNFKNESAETRSLWLKAIHAEMIKRKDEFIDLIVKEAGKPIGYALGEFNRSLTTLGWAAEEILRYGGEVVPMDFGAGKRKTAFTKRCPLGVILGISPFNFPLNLAMHKIAPAIATGNSIIIKPSPYTPLTMMLFEEVCRSARLPEGLFQLALCDVAGSEFLVTDEEIKLLSFTGSPKVGWMLKEKAGKKKVVLELGGNAGVLVDETVDLKRTAKLLAQGAYLYAGQICISTQRIYAVKEVKLKLQNLLLEEIRSLGVGDPLDEKNSVGPLIDKDHCERVLSWIAEAKNRNAVVLCGGEYKDPNHNLLLPTLLTDTKPDMKVVCEEVFGPVAILESVDSFDAGIEALNNTPFGLQAGVFTESLSRMKKAINEIDVGGVMVNNIPGFRVDSMPYGGIKDSGLGREGLKYSFEEMTEGKLVVF